MSECQICYCDFEPWEDEYGDIEDEWCKMCTIDNEIGAAADGDMGCEG